MDRRFLPVTKDRWSDLEALFESRGGPHYCWCTAWRRNDFKESLPGKVGKKASIKQRVDQGIPIGLLAYVEDKPVGWCSVAPRDTFRDLGGDHGLEGVWSIVCFFVKREHRRQGLTLRLIDAAIDCARNNDAKYLEAYPVDPDSPSYRFMGVRSHFENAGFKFVKKASSRRNVMILALT